MNRPEEQLHRACADLLRLYEARGLLAFCHVPNGFGRTRAEAALPRRWASAPACPTYWCGCRAAASAASN